MNSLNFYLTYDHKARSRVTFMGFVLGAAAGMFAEGILGQTPRIGFISCFGMAGLVEFLGAYFYRTPSSESQRVVMVENILQRRVLLAAACVSLLLICGLVIPFRLSLPDVFAKEIATAAAHPGDPRSVTKVQEAVKHAMERQIKIDPRVISRAGTSFIDAAAQDQSAWSAVNPLLDYRSIGTSVRIVHPVAVPTGSKTYLMFEEVPGKPFPSLMGVQGVVAKADAAVLQRIGANLNEDLDWGPAELVLSGGAAGIDNLSAKHVIFRNVAVYYNGKAVQLEDVVFDHCTFAFANAPFAQQLAKTILESSPVTFTSQPAANSEIGGSVTGSNIP